MKKSIFSSYLIFFILLVSFKNFTLHAVFFSNTTMQALEQENQTIANSSIEMAAFYNLEEGEKIRDITNLVLASPDTTQTAKEDIIAYHRRLYVFSYPSDNLTIKGFISLAPHPENHPLLILFRWGNRDFALFNPGIEMANYRDYTVVSSTLRGGINEGQDEFGGSDTNDMKNLITFLPQLAEELHVSLTPTHTYMLGPSRGGLEMFLTLARYPALQNKVEKIVSLSGILDLHQQIQDRPNDMKAMFIKDFGLVEEQNESNWIKQRDPLETVSSLKKSLPILIIQGTEDNRINLKEGHHMVQKLEENNHTVTYWELKGGNHTLTNLPHFMDRIVCWLESDASSTSC